MQNVTLTAAEATATYSALRKYVEVLEDIVADAAQFPEEADEDETALAVAEAAQIHAILDKLVAA